MQTQTVSTDLIHESPVVAGAGVLEKAMHLPNIV